MIREPHTLSFRNPGPPEEVDTLLRGFFRSEMPDPWPVLKAPNAGTFRAAQPAAPRWTSVRSRVALAASVALLLLGSWCFSARTPDYSMTPQNNNGSVGTASNTPIYLGGFKLQAPKTETKKGACCGGCCGDQ